MLVSLCFVGNPNVCACAHDCLPVAVQSMFGGATAFAQDVHTWVTTSLTSCSGFRPLTGRVFGRSPPQLVELGCAPYCPSVIVANSAAVLEMGLDAGALGDTRTIICKTGYAPSKASITCITPGVFDAVSCSGSLHRICCGIRVLHISR